jgi:hypothetical protein
MAERACAGGLKCYFMLNNCLIDGYVVRFLIRMLILQAIKSPPAPAMCILALVIVKKDKINDF